VSVFCGKLSFFLLVIALSVRLKFTACDCIFGILRLFFLCLSYRDIFQTFWKEVAVAILIVIHLTYFLLRMNIIDGVMVSMVCSMLEYRGFCPDRVILKTLELLLVALLLITQH